VRAIRYHDEARLELVHEVGYYTAVSARLGERFDKRYPIGGKARGRVSSAHALCRQLTVQLTLKLGR